jgi:transposase
MKPKAETTAAALAVIGVDIGKDVFHLVGFGVDGKIAFRRRIRRLGLKDAFERLPPCIVGMEACLSAHFVSRTLRALGHEPRIIPAIYVKPFVKGQKNDYNDAEAIAEAALRPNLRFVQEKSQDQLDLQACHRVRSRLVSRRTATINQIRAFLIEQGIAVRSGPRALRNSLFAILENRKDEISPRTAKLIGGLYEDWCGLDERIETVTGEIEELGQAEAKCRQLRSIPGVGPHHGRIVKTTGDGLLVEFASVVDAARCAVEVQQSGLSLSRTDTAGSSKLFDSVLVVAGNGGLYHPAFVARSFIRDVHSPDG